MLKDIGEIRSIRKKLGLTQNELADKAGVSQSLIAKVENGTTMPSYSKGRLILDTLHRMMDSTGSNTKAKDVQSKDLLALHPRDTIGDAINLMKENAVSQLPVIEDGLPTGGVTESCLLNNFEELNRNECIETIMDSPFPLVEEDADLELVKELLRHYPSVLTSKEGEIIGIITKADILKEI